MKTALIALMLLATYPDTGQTAPPPAPGMWVYCMKGCDPCRLEKHDSKKCLEFDWHFQEWDGRGKVPATFAYVVHEAIARGEGFPFTVWKTPHGWHCESGYTDLKTLKEQYAATQK